MSRFESDRTSDQKALCTNECFFILHFESPVLSLLGKTPSLSASTIDRQQPGRTVLLCQSYPEKEPRSLSIFFTCQLIAVTKPEADRSLFLKDSLTSSTTG